MTLITGNLGQNLYAATLNERNSFKMVHDLSNGYNKLATLASILNINTGGTRIDTHDGKYEYSWDRRKEVITTIQNATLSGSNLVLTFHDPSYDAFRVKDLVMDSNEKKGRVIATAPGTITIEPTAYTFDTALHFTANQYVKVVTDLSGVRDSAGKTSLFSIPNTDYNYCQVTRDSLRLSRKDKIATLVHNGEKFWYSSAERDMLDRMFRADERTLIHGERFQYNSPVEGLINGNGGLDWSIKNRGGLYKPLTSKITRDVFHDILLEHQVRCANGGNSIIMTGSAALMAMNEDFTGDFIKYAGRTNTFGGEKVKGLSVEMYAIAGKEYPIIVNPALNDTEYYPETSSIPGVRGTRMSNRFYLLDLSPIPVVGSAAKLPAIERIYWGQDETLYRVIPGMVGNNGNSTGGQSLGQYQVTSNSVDGYQCEVLKDMGWNIPDASRLTLVEYIR